MLKLTGCLLVFISCSILGFMKAASYKARSRELENILEIIKLLELEISYRKEPLAKTFQKSAALKPCWFSRVLRECSEALKQQQPLQEAWCSAVDRHEKESPLIASDMEILKDLALGLGKSDTAGQSRLLEPVMLRLQQQLRNAREQETKQGKMYRGLGLSAGIVIVIMII